MYSILDSLSLGEKLGVKLGVLVVTDNDKDKEIKQDYLHIVTVTSSIQPRGCRAVLGASIGERESPGCRDQATHMWEAHIRRTVIRM